MIKLTDRVTGATTVVDEHDVAETLREWSPDAPAEVTQAISDFTDALGHDDFAARGLAEYLAVDFTELPDFLVVSIDPADDLSVSGELLDTYDADLSDEEYDRRDVENARRVDLFDTALCRALAMEATERGVTVEVVRCRPDQATRTPMRHSRGDLDTWEQVVWQAAQDRVGAGERDSAGWTAWV